MIGVSAGFTFLIVGGYGMPAGKYGLAALIAASTSIAALSMSRDRSNWTVSCVKPSALAEVSWVTPAICENCCSNGVATEDAMVCGSAPGNCAVTWMVGKFTFGSDATGSSR